MFYLNMMDYPMFFILLSTKNNQGHLSDTKGYSAQQDEDNEYNGPRQIWHN